MLEGRVPTTSTTASVIAGMQVQEAVKLLHADRIGPPELAGAGFQFVGLTHDSYVVRYPRRETCLSHDTYALDEAEPVAEDVTFGALLGRARELLGPQAVLDLEHEIVIAARCGECDAREELLRPVEALGASAALCPACGAERALEFTHGVEDGSPLLERTSQELGLPPRDVVTGRAGFDRRFFLLP
jgi:adenylyltransferase/sulfurtransferase